LISFSLFFSWVESEVILLFKLSICFFRPARFALFFSWAGAYAAAILGRMVFIHSSISPWLSSDTDLFKQSDSVTA